MVLLMSLKLFVINMCNNINMVVTGQSDKEKEFLNKIMEKNLNRQRLPRGIFVEDKQMNC